MPDLTEVLMRLAEPALAPPDPLDDLERRVRSRRRTRRMVRAAVTVICAVAVGLPAFGVLAGREDTPPVQVETSQTTVATVPPTPASPSGRFLPTWLPGDLKVQTEEERQLRSDAGRGWIRLYTRNLPTGRSDTLLLSLQDDAEPLDVDRDVARYAGARRIDVQGRPGLVLPIVAGRSQVTVAWSPRPGQLAQVQGSGVTEEELITFAQKVVPPPRLDATPVPEGFRETMNPQNGESHPPPTPRRYEVSTTAFRARPSTAVRVVAMWDEPLTPGTAETVRGRPGVLSTNGADTNLAWLERPGLLVTVTGTNVGLEDLRRVAAGLREQSMEEVLGRQNAGRVLLARGVVETGSYELWASGSCLELAMRSVARTCGDISATAADVPMSIGLGVAFGPVVPEAARVRLELPGGRTVETPAVGAAAGLGAAFYVAVLPGDYGRVVAVVALGPDGRVLRRTPVG